MLIDEKIADLQRTLPEHVTLVAISKTHPEQMISCAYQAGQRIFGENKPQELKVKYEALPKDINWHMIGHLQSNKVRMIAPFVAMIHSVDSARLLELISCEAERCGRVIDVLFEVHVAREQSKHGWQTTQLREYMDSGEYRSLPGVRICGLMGVATFTDDTDVIRSEFGQLHTLFNEFKAAYFAGVQYFNTLSMGMTSDYLIAIEQGATMVRIGSLIFGTRDYNVK